MRLSLRLLVFTGGSLGVLFGLPWLALMSLAGQLFSLPYPPFELFEWFTRLLPGGLVTFGIDSLVRLLSALNLGPTAQAAKTAEILMAYGLFLALLFGMGALLAIFTDRLRMAWAAAGVLAGLALALISTALAIWGGWDPSAHPGGLVWLLAASLGWGLLLVWSLSRLTTTITQQQNAARRRFLGGLALGSLGLALAALGIERWISGQKTTAGPVAEAPQLPAPGSMPTPQPTAAGFVNVPGTRPEITPIDDFYRVDINLLPPRQRQVSNAASSLAERLAIEGETDLPAESYRLVVDGFVANRLVLDLPAIMAFPTQEQYATLECISNPVGGDLISTTLFQGARLKDVLEKAGLQPGAVDIKFTCVDGYTESLPIDSAMDPRTLLCYAMGNQPLTEKHGAPIRLYTPDRFGMKNPKWIIRIEAVNEDYLGYWEQRRWSEQAWVQTTSVIDAANPSGGQVQVGGIAFAGARGISAVEIQADGGEWQPAMLNNPLSPLTWVLWSAVLQLSPGEHRLTVRAIDGDGAIQTAQVAPTHPDGATGLHSFSITF
jgi:DMSO/TMAO reductase YedYZ molybdopterin-dependent catalytic subunit